MMAYSIHAPMSQYPHQYYSPHCAQLPQAPLPSSRSINMSSYHHHSPSRQQREVSPARSRPTTAESESRPKPFLPSISNLLGIADGERLRHDGAASKPPLRLHSEYAYRSRTPQMQSSPQSVHSNPVSSFAGSQRTTSVNGSPPRAAIAPSSASTSPTIASLVTPARHIPISALNNADAQSTQHPTSAPTSAPYNTSPRTTSPYRYSPSTTSNASSHSAATGPASASGVPPATPTSPWATHEHQPHHHHYINASSQITFPPAQERYVCPKCQKAFSRPSSLKIHSHSHTGEKPFICPYPACGKSFSVRSNMRRHERGCHSPPRPGR